MNHNVIVFGHLQICLGTSTGQELNCMNKCEGAFSLLRSVLSTAERGVSRHVPAGATSVGQRDLGHRSRRPPLSPSLPLGEATHSASSSESEQERLAQNARLERPRGTALPASSCFTNEELQACGAWRPGVHCRRVSVSELDLGSPAAKCSLRAMGAIGELNTGERHATVSSLSPNTLLCMNVEADPKSLDHSIICRGTSGWIKPHSPAGGAVCKAPSQKERMASPDTKPARALTLEFPTSRAVSHPGYIGLKAGVPGICEDKSSY
nr:uncharacterized protein LOC105872792 [Microcebus murinus]